LLVLCTTLKMQPNSGLIVIKSRSVDKRGHWGSGAVGRLC
jgi:hypothetical protein